MFHWTLPRTGDEEDEELSCSGEEEAANNEQRVDIQSRPASWEGVCCT